MNKNIHGRVVLGLGLAVALSGSLAAQSTPGGVLDMPNPLPYFTSACDTANPTASQAFLDCENSAYTLLGGKDYGAFVAKWAPRCATYCATQQWQGHVLGCGDYDFKSVWTHVQNKRCTGGGANGVCKYTYGFASSFGRCCSLADPATNWAGYVTNAAATTCSLGKTGGSPAPPPPAPTASRVSPTAGTGLMANTGQTLAFSVLCTGTNLKKVEWHFNGAVAHTVSVTGASAAESWSKQFTAAGPFGIKALCVDANNKYGQAAWMGSVTVATPATLASPSSVPSGPTAPGTPAPPTGYSPGGPSAPVTPSVPQFLDARWGGYSNGAHHVGRGEAQNVANSCNAAVANNISNWARKQVNTKTGRTDCTIQNRPDLLRNAGSASGKYDCKNHHGRTLCSGYCNAPARSMTINYLCP